MPKTIIINEEMANELKDMLTMTQFKFKANIKKFLASLLEDPTGTEPDMIFTKNGLDKNKLIKALVDNKVITKKMTIDDHDADGNPHTAKMIVKYSVPKERFNERLDALYDILFPDVEGKINEDGAAGGGAASCSGVDGNGFGSGEFVQPLFGGISVRKKKKDKKSVGGNPYTLNESQESKSIDAAKRLFMQRTGKSAEEADKFVRVDLRNDLPVLRDKNGAKFILGVTRMFLDGQLRDARTVQNLNKILKLLTQGHFNEYDRNLNDMSAQDVISRFATAMKQMGDQEREELGNMQFNENNNYQIVRIDNFEQASQYGQYTSWCVTHYENMFNSYTSNGLGQFYFCLRNGFENEPAEPGEGCPLDSYGLSMVAVSVDENGRLNTCTCRWNHDNGGNDNIMGVKEISELIGQNFFDVFKPNGKWTEIVENVKSRLAAGESPDDVFDYCGNFKEGLAVVKLNGKWNWIRQDNGQLFSDQWFDECSIFNGGLAWVVLNEKYNWIRQDNGQPFSDQWFDDCWNFEEGLAVVKLNGKWNWIRQDNGRPFSDQWFDDCCEFNGGLAWVELNGNENWVRADNGQYFSDQWFDYCGDFEEGLAVVKLNGKENWVRADNGQYFSDQWFDDCWNFNEGLARVRINGKWNWIRVDNGQYFSDQWFEYCWSFREGLARVKINGKLYYMRKDGVLCDYETKEPIQQPGLNEMVYRILKRIISEAVTGEDGRKSSAVYAYAKNSNGEWCILAAKRNKKWDDEGGKMNPPMGHRHKYESPEDGAVRECEEESGIRFNKKDLVLASKEDWGTNFKLYLPGKTSDYKPGEGDEENTKFRWIPVSQIDNYEWAWSCGTFAKRFKPKKSLNELNTKTYQNAASVAYERGKYDEPDDRVKKFRNAAIQAHRNNNKNFAYSKKVAEDEKLQDNFVNDNSNEKLVIFDPDYTNLKSLYDGVKQGRLLIHCRKVDENNIPRVIEPEFGDTVQDAYGYEFGDDIEKPELIFASDDFSWSKAYPGFHSSYSDQRNGVFFVYSNNFDKYLGDGYIQSVDGRIYMSDDTPITVESGDWFTDQCVDVAAVLIIK